MGHEGGGRGKQGLPHALDNVLGVLVLLLAYEEMSVLGHAALDLHELVELEHAPLAAAVALAALVEDGRARVVHAALFDALAASLGGFVRGIAGLALAGRAVRDRQARVVLLVLGRRCGRARGRRRGLRGQARGRRRVV